MILATIALGGAIGAVARYGLSGWVHQVLPETFPWGTLVVNVVGCFALGFSYRALQVSVVSPEMRGFVTIGLLGAFTTFSTFGYEAVALMHDGEWLRAGAYVVASLLVGLGAVLCGLWVAASVLHPRP